MKPAIDDLPARSPVWSALSDLFLDIDVSLSRAWRVEQLAHSPRFPYGPKVQCRGGSGA